MEACSQCTCKRHVSQPGKFPEHFLRPFLRLACCEHLVLSHAGPTTEVNTGEELTHFQVDGRVWFSVRRKGRQPTQERSKQKDETVLSRLGLV